MPQLMRVWTFGSGAETNTLGETGAVTMFLKAVEQPDGQWSFRFGREDLGVMPDAACALDLLEASAVKLGGRDLFEFFLHYLDGSVDRVPATH